MCRRPPLPTLGQGVNAEGATEGRLVLVAHEPLSTCHDRVRFRDRVRNILSGELAAEEYEVLAQV